MPLTKLAILENEIEARILHDILNERQISHKIKPYGDDTFGNLFQLQKGWGAVYASLEHKPELLEILADLRNQTLEPDYEE